MSTIIEVLGRNVRFLRKKAGWTQEELAEKSGISVPFMTQIELGRKSASLAVIEKLANAFNVSYETLFVSEEKMNTDEPFKLLELEKKLIKTISADIHNEIDSLSK